MKTHDKKWAIQQMLDGAIVTKNGVYGARFNHNTFKFEWVNQDCSGNELSVNELDDHGWYFYKEPDEVKLPEEVNITKLKEDNGEMNTGLQSGALYVLERQNEIIKYLKAEAKKY